MLKNYGVTREQYEKMNEEQNGLCAICRNPPTGGTNKTMLEVDHCHESMRVRGLLCGPCNRLLGLMGRYFKHKVAFDAYLDPHA